MKTPIKSAGPRSKPKRPLSGVGLAPADAKPPESPPSIALVDSDLQACTDLCAALRELAPAWKFECHLDFGEAADELVRVPPSAVLMEVCGKDLPGIDCTRRLKARVSDLPVVMLTARSDAVSVFLSITAGAAGYLKKPASARTVLRALNRAMHGKRAFTARSQGVLMDYLRSWTSRAAKLLSPQERLIMGCLIQNYVDKDIEKLLAIEYSTLHAHLESIYRKLNAHGRHEAIRKFLGLE